jgi:acetyltransferase-like isoleucine patch superfamily enzyme
VLRLALARLRARGRLRAARGVRLGSGVRVDVRPGGSLELGSGVAIGDGSRLDVASGDVRIGAGSVLGRRCVVAARERVTVGERCRLGDEVVLMDFDRDVSDVERPVREQALVTGAIAIGDGAVLDDTVVVLRGATVGPSARVTTRSVVTRDVPAGTTVGGVPARS